MSAEEKTTNVIQRHAQPIRVRLIRGAGEWGRVDELDGHGPD